MNPPGTINPMSSTGIPGGTSLIGSGNALAAAGPAPMGGPPAAGAGVGPGALIDLAVKSTAKGMQSSANLMGMIDDNPMHKGLDINMTPEQAFQQTQDYFGSVGENLMGSVPVLNLLGLDKLTGELSRMMTRKAAMARAAELAEAQRDLERKAMADYRDSYGGDTFNSIF